MMASQRADSPILAPPHISGVSYTLAATAAAAAAVVVVVVAAAAAAAAAEAVVVVVVVVAAAAAATTTAIIIIIIMMIALKGANRDFYSLLTSPRNVSNIYAQVARAKSCKSRATH